MGIFDDHLAKARGEKVPESTKPVVPPGFQQVVDSLDSFMPGIEQITGLSRKELTLHLVKAGIKGGSIDSVLGGLMGKPPAADVKIVRLIKTFAIWIPIGIGLIGFILVSLLIYTKFLLSLIT